MKPIDFEEKTVDIAKDQPQYITLPAHVRDSDEGEVIFCMNLSFQERIQILLTGKLWCCILTFSQKLQPSRFSVFKKDFFPE